MAYFDQTYAPKHSFVTVLKNLFETPFDRKNKEIAAKVAELRGLSDAQLSEMGITRSEILVHVFGTATR